MTGMIFDIQRFSIQDGPGIRTTVFLKGCPLHCLWCHNPESGDCRPELFYEEKKCAGCLRCEAVCPKSLHRFEKGDHFFQREGCLRCMRCAGVCPTKALERCGEEKETGEILSVVLKDEIFYRQSNGGMTLSGGEPLLQYDFSTSLLAEAKAMGLHTAVETSGYCTRNLEEINRYVDLWLYDIKLTDREQHLRYTGVFPEIIWENLRFLNRIGAHIVMRCPIIPDVNLTEEHFRGVALLARELSHLQAVQFEPYHPLGVRKNFRLGKKPPYTAENFLNPEEIVPFVEKVRDRIPAKVEVL